MSWRRIMNLAKTPSSLTEHWLMLMTGRNFRSYWSCRHLIVVDSSVTVTGSLRRRNSWNVVRYLFWHWGIWHCNANQDTELTKWSICIYFVPSTNCDFKSAACHPWRICVILTSRLFALLTKVLIFGRGGKCRMFMQFPVLVILLWAVNQVKCLNLIYVFKLSASIRPRTITTTTSHPSSFRRSQVLKNMR